MSPGWAVHVSSVPGKLLLGPTQPGPLTHTQPPGLAQLPREGTMGLVPLLTGLSPSTSDVYGQGQNSSEASSEAGFVVQS